MKSEPNPFGEQDKEAPNTEDAIRKLNGELEARVNRRTKAFRKANEKLQREIAERHRLEKQILHISEREQQRIGRDLHDDLGQRLVGISYMCQVLTKSLETSDSPEAGQAAKITELLNKALSLTRSLARGLNPVALKSGGLVAALADLAERTSEMFGVGCHFTSPLGEPVVNEITATHLYRIAQEAVTNAVNHGKASDIQVEISSYLDHVILMVRDNGTGMPPQLPSHSGMGLSIMKYRAQVIGAYLEFTSPEVGSGTIVTCSVATS